MLESFFRDLLRTGAGCSLLLAAFLVLRPLLLRRYSASASKLIWLMAAVRLLFPWKIPLPPAPKMVQIAQVLPTDTIYRLMPDMVQAGPSLPGAKGILLLWLAGAGGYLVWHLFRSLGFSARVRRWSTPVLEEGILACYSICVQKLELRHFPELRQSSEIATPMLVGVLRPVILLPMGGLSGDAHSPILLHELCHYKNRDLWLKLFALCAGGLHWFNPLVQISIRCFFRDLEAVCDETALRGASVPERTAYGEAIIDCAAGHPAPRSMYLAFSVKSDALRRRVLRIMDGRRRKRGLVWSLTALLLIVYGGALVQSVPAAGEALHWLSPVPGSAYITVAFGQQFTPESAAARSVCYAGGAGFAGSPVVACTDGLVLASVDGQAREAVYENRNYGNYLVVQYGGYTAIYKHLSEISVQAGDTVARGQTIASVGATGSVTGPCLGFEVQKDGVPVDPEPLMG